MSGELRGGRLVGGFVGEQFAAPDAVDALRATRRDERRGELVTVSASDPLNLVGIVTPGPRVAASHATTVTYRDGVPQPAAGSSEATQRPALVRATSRLVIRAPARAGNGARKCCLVPAVVVWRCNRRHDACRAKYLK